MFRLTRVRCSLTWHDRAFSLRRVGSLEARRTLQKRVKIQMQDAFEEFLAESYENLRILQPGEVRHARPCRREPAGQAQGRVDRLANRDHHSINDKVLTCLDFTCLDAPVRVTIVEGIR